MIEAEPQHNVGPRPLAQSYHTGDSQVVQHRDEAQSELKGGFKIEKKEQSLELRLKQWELLSTH